MEVRSILDKENPVVDPFVGDWYKHSYGFSLIEIIICLAMVSILSVGAFALSGHIKYANVKKSVKQLNQKIETTRMNGMSKVGKWNLYIYKESDGVYYYLTDGNTLERSSGVRVGGNRIRLFYTVKGGSETEATASNGSTIHIQFAKNTGSFIAQDGAEIYETIRLADGDTKGYIIRLIEKTGKHFVE